jgi:enoyl-CoA hydratase
MSEQVVLNVQDSIAEIVLDRPEKLNAMTPEMNAALARICADVDADDAVRVVLLRGAGERAFSAGSDIGALATYPSAWAFRNRVEHATIVRNIRKPVIAALKGWVLGGGLEMALAADIRVAGIGARFGTPEVTRGWVGGGGASQLLPRLIGYGRAMRLLLTGETVDANEALALGLVEYLVEDAAVEDKAWAICRTLAGYSPIAVQSVKAAVRAALSMPLDAGLRYENDLTSLCFASGNYKDGIQAFGGRRG